MEGSESVSYLLSSKWVKTRKPHRCFGCAREFPSSSAMLFEVCVDDGIFNLYLCETCDKVQQTLDDEFCYGDLREDALEMEGRH